MQRRFQRSVYFYQFAALFPAKKKHHVKTSENIFLSPVSTDGLVRLILYSKFAENPFKKMDTIARALGSCSLRLMGSWLKKSGIWQTTGIQTTWSALAFVFHDTQSTNKNSSCLLLHSYLALSQKFHKQLLD